MSIRKLIPRPGPGKAGDDFIDWDMWLGHKWGLAPKIPWTPEHFFRFRKYWPYNGGVATDLLYHKLAPLLIAISGPNGEYPKRVNANGGLYIEKDGRDIPDVFMMTVDYPSEWSLFLVSTLTNDAGIPGSHLRQTWHHGFGRRAKPALEWRISRMSSRRRMKARKS